jgi:hypothetical protein
LRLFAASKQSEIKLSNAAPPTWPRGAARSLIPPLPDFFAGFFRTHRRIGGKEAPRSFTGAR